jgi:phospholipid/cholesterol/gamma-HCH transport system permease protein
MIEADWPFQPVRRLGARVLGSLRYGGQLTLLGGAVLRAFVSGLLMPRVRFPRRAISEQVVRVGVRSLGIILLVQVFLGLILALQLTPPLAEPFHQEQQVSRIIGVAGFRMLGPILTAVVLSGFAGASIAAELGTMVVGEEIEALEAMALNPVRFLVVPRVAATAVMTTLLTIISDLTIAFGGWATARLALPRPVWQNYWADLRDQLTFADFWTGLAMAFAFGLLISLIACREGLRVRGGAEGVGRATTMTVVYSIVAVVIAASVFTVIFYALGL